MNDNARQFSAKPRKPWYKKKRFIIPLALLATLVIVGIAGGGQNAEQGDNETSGTTAATPPTDETTTTTKGGLDSGRPDRQREDQEREIGQSAQVSGYVATVTSTQRTQRLSDFEASGYVLADVSVENKDQRAQPYNVFDWKIQTPNGQVIDPTFSSVNPTLGSGSLVTNGKVQGKVVFEVGQTSGDFYIIYKPDPFDAARGIWKVS